jgi:hypothetical protein
MIRKYMLRRSARFAIFIGVLILCAPLLTSMAQSNGLDLIQTAEYDIGFECPVASVLDPTGTTLWLLMNNCGQSDFVLRAYNVADGSQVNENDYADALAGLADPEVYVDAFIKPLAFTPEGDLSIRYTNIETYQSLNLLIPLASGGEPTTETSADYDAFLAEYSDYPDFSVYSPDHTRVVAVGATSFHILDVQTQTEIIEIPVEGSTDYAWALFSSDGERLEVTNSNNPDDPDDHSVTLFIYSLTDGELLHQYQLPSSVVWVSPDGVYAAVNLYSNNIGDLNELVVIDLETGVTSAASNLDEDPRSVTTCLNSGNDVSDVGYMTDGRFSFPDLHWLADSSGIVLPLSYGGDGAGGGSICIFNYSRLRTYQVEEAG